MISVIMPAYNSENTISESVQSVLDQTHTDFELIIINDGSKDRTLSIIDSISTKDKRVSVHTQDNAGVAIARNHGLMLAKGKYISFLDSDDMYCPDFLATMRDEAENKQAQVTYCGYNQFSYGDSQAKKTKILTRTPLLDYIKGKLSLHTSSWLLSRSFVLDNELMFREGASWGEDFEFFCQALALSSRTASVNAYLTNYRVAHSDNQLSSHRIDKMDLDYESIMILISYDSIASCQKAIEALINYRLSALLSYRFLQAMQTNDTPERLQHYFQTYREYLTTYNWNNGLRSVKLNLTKFRIKRRMAN